MHAVTLNRRYVNGRCRLERQTQMQSRTAHTLYDAELVQQLERKPMLQSVLKERQVALKIGVNKAATDSDSHITPLQTASAT